MKLITNSNSWLTATDSSKPNDVRDVLLEAGRRGGIFARWQINREVDKAYVSLAKVAVGTLFDAKREELNYRTQLALDAAKKRAIAENLAETADIERAIANMTAEVLRELGTLVETHRMAVYAKEAASLRALEEAVANGKLAPERIEEARMRLTMRVTDLADKLDAIADRVIENLGNRLSQALNLSGK